MTCFDKEFYRKQTLDKFETEWSVFQRNLKNDEWFARAIDVLMRIRSNGIKSEEFYSMFRDTDNMYVSEMDVEHFNAFHHAIGYYILDDDECNLIKAKIAKSVFHRIFPEDECGCLDESIKMGKENYCYFLVSNDGNTIGMFGIYEEQSDNSSAWLGWFGVLPEYRLNENGRRIIKEFENYARLLGYKFARLYTDKLNNDGALKFYAKCGYSFEEYACKDIALKNPLVIGSKSISDEDCPKWSNRELEF